MHFYKHVHIHINLLYAFFMQSLKVLIPKSHLHECAYQRRYTKYNVFICVCACY